MVVSVSIVFYLPFLKLLYSPVLRHRNSPQGGFDKSLENMEAPHSIEEETDKENKVSQSPAGNLGSCQSELRLSLHHHSCC